LLHVGGDGGIARADGGIVAQNASPALDLAVVIKGSVLEAAEELPTSHGVDDLLLV
jgi:hypothetical protein